MAQTESPHAGGFIVSEATGSRSREVVTILANTPTMLPGHVLGRITASGKYTDHDDAHSDGSEVAAAVLFDGTTTSGSDQTAVALVRDAEVNGPELQWTDAVGDAASGIVDLATKGIIAR
jgi:hypothetical protein